MAKKLPPSDLSQYSTPTLLAALHGSDVAIGECAADQGRLVRRMCEIVNELEYRLAGAKKTASADLDVVELHAAGERPKEIAGKLNQRGSKTSKGETWKNNRVRKILENHREKLKKG